MSRGRASGWLFEWATEWATEWDTNEKQYEREVCAFWRRDKIRKIFELLDGGGGPKFPEGEKKSRKKIS